MTREPRSYRSHRAGVDRLCPPDCKECERERRFIEARLREFRFDYKEPEEQHLPRYAR